MSVRSMEAEPSRRNVHRVMVQFTLVALVLPSIMIILASLSSQPVLASGWGPRILVSDDNANNIHWSGEQDVATDIFGNAYVVWTDLSELDGSGSDSDIFLRKWDASAQSWDRRVLISDDNVNNTMSSYEPRVVADSLGNIHVIWAQPGDLSGSGDDTDIFWKMWDVTTAIWGPRVLVTDEVNNTGTSHGQELAADLFGNIHLVWDDWSSLIPNPGVQYRKWNGTTRTWENRMSVTTNSTGSWLTDIAVDSFGNVHIAWADMANISGASSYGTDYDIFYRSYDSSAKVWGPIVHVNDDDDDMDQNGSNFWSLTTDIFGNVHFVWDEHGDQTGMGIGRDHNVFYRKLKAATGIWEPRVVLSHEPGKDWGSLRSQIGSDPFGGVHVVWIDWHWRNGGGTLDAHVFYKEWNISTGLWESTVSLTESLPRGQRIDDPRIASDGYGNLFVVWADGTGLLGSGDDIDVYLKKFESWISPPLFIDLRTEVVNTDDISVRWTVSDISFVDHFLLYRSEDQTGFDFSTPLLNTSNSPDPLRMDWIDVDAAGPIASREYYYIVRAVVKSGEISVTSNTAGKWTRSFRGGRDAFSLPLEPFVNRNVSWYSENIPGTEFIRWMDATGHWVNHYPAMGEGVNDIPAIMGDSYEISLSTQIAFTFCGYPASMIRFSEGMGDSVAFRRSLSAQVEGNDISLSWGSVIGADWYYVFRSDWRNGLHDLSASPIANTTDTHWIDSGVVGSQRSEYYYTVIPVDSSGGLGSSTYSVGVFTAEYQSGSDAFALPLKPLEVHSLDWYCDNIPNVVGIIHLMKGYWRLHVREMPEGVYDAQALQSEGYQISIHGSPTIYTFIGS